MFSEIENWWSFCDFRRKYKSHKNVYLNCKYRKIWFNLTIHRSVLSNRSLKFNVLRSFRVHNNEGPNGFLRCHFFQSDITGGGGANFCSSKFHFTRRKLPDLSWWIIKKLLFPNNYGLTRTTYTDQKRKYFFDHQEIFFVKHIFDLQNCPDLENVFRYGFCKFIPVIFLQFLFSNAN